MPIKIIEERTTLVIAGAWNPAILQPAWVAREAMGQADVNFQVGMQVPVGDPTQPVRVSFEGIAYTAAPNAVAFFLRPEDLGQVQKTVTIAAKILELLPHTPVSGVGFNFSYQIEEPAAVLLGTFDKGADVAAVLADEQAEAVQGNWGATIKTAGKLLTVTASIEGGAVAFSFNAHYEVKTAQAAANQLKVEGLYGSIVANVESIVNKYAGEA